jgi:hypothetical protein
MPHLRSALSASAEDAKDGKPLSAASAAAISAAETTDTLTWQVQESKASAQERAVMMSAGVEWANSRKHRLGLRGDQWKAAQLLMSDRLAEYSNYLNRRGTDKQQRVLPTTKAKASSDWDWDAAIEAKLMFAALPNINPKKPIAGALHASA